MDHQDKPAREGDGLVADKTDQGEGLGSPKADEGTPRDVPDLEVIERTLPNQPPKEAP